MKVSVCVLVSISTLNFHLLGIIVATDSFYRSWQGVFLAGFYIRRLSVARSIGLDGRCPTIIALRSTYTL